MRTQRLLRVMMLALVSAIVAGLLVSFLPVIRTVGPSGEIRYANPLQTSGAYAVLHNIAPAVVSAVAVIFRRWRFVRILATLPYLYYAVLALPFLFGAFFIPAAALQVLAVFLPYEEARPGEKANA